MTNIKTKSHDNNIAPTILDTGNSYHIYLPVGAFVLESENIFIEPSKKFILWAEQYLSDRKEDSFHSKGLSFKTCMLRVPGSINSKNSAQVRIIQKWNGVRPAISWLLRESRRYLIQDKIEWEQYRDTIKAGYENSSAHTILWIDTLIPTAISDYRKNTIRLILALYLMNIKRLSF